MKKRVVGTSVGTPGGFGAGVIIGNRVADGLAAALEADVTLWCSATGHPTGRDAQRAQRYRCGLDGRLHLCIQEWLQVKLLASHPQKDLVPLNMRFRCAPSIHVNAGGFDDRPRVCPGVAGSARRGCTRRYRRGQATMLATTCRISQYEIQSPHARHLPQSAARVLDTSP